MNILQKIGSIFAGDPLKRYWEIVEEINAKESEFEDLSLSELQDISSDFRERVEGGEETMDDILTDAFALVREVSKRTLGQRHYDVQLICGMVLHEGKIAEMLTGEGKTLASTLPLYLNALKGEGAHLVTVNDYLAKRDAVWMGQIYDALGLSVSCLTHESAYIYDPEYVPGEESEELDQERDEKGSFEVVEEFLRPISRREAYEADITYGTNHHFGFDYLRDNSVLNLEDRVQRGHHFTIIDEVDSILIDEARTPLIISAPDEESSKYYKKFASVAKRLQEPQDYTVDEEHKSVNITDAGIEKVEKALDLDNIYSPENDRLVHFLNESLKAQGLYNRDKEYVVKNNEIILVDEFTGRLMPGRRLSGGLHQAIEAKEGVPVKQESRTQAKITIQNFFRMYEKLSGMTGTAQTSAEEFDEVYDLEVISVPPNEPVIRDDMSDLVYKTKETKYSAVAEEVKRRHEEGQPVLLGTTSIDNNEIFSKHLDREGVPHEVLNAKNHEREGEIIAQAGSKGAVTVATNMAGRGVDIVLGGAPLDKERAEEVKELGGLHVLGTERHESRRVDNQLRGRAGRQGDPGSSQFFLSLEDDLLRVFGGDRVQRMMGSMKVPDDMPIESKLVSKVVNQAQSKVEGMNLDMRKHLLKFDDVLNKQREALYNRRLKYLKAGEENNVMPIVREIIEDYITDTRQSVEQEIAELRRQGADEEDVKEREKFLEGMEQVPDKIPEEVEPERARAIGQQMTRILDILWINNLEDLKSLRQSVSIRAYGKKEPIVEYRREAHILYKQLNHKFRQFVFRTMPQVLEADIKNVKPKRAKRTSGTGRSKDGKRPPADTSDIGRNDPCWCGSGTKYKYCHGG